MEKAKILIVEDDPKWIIKYKRYLEGEAVDIDDVGTAKEALEKFKIKYYSLVLLDLSLHPSHSEDRTSEEVQIYLKKGSEGTKHIIISAHADKYDVRKGAINYNAFGVFFKDEFENIVPFLESVKNAIIANKREKPDFNEDAYEIFCGDMDYNLFEYRILELFKPEKGIAGWFNFKEKFIKSIAPIYNHITRKNIEFKGNCILGLFWSRQLGNAISICIANRAVKDEECLEAINTWLGWDHSNGVKILENNIQGYFYIEADLSPEDFNFSKKI